MANQTLAEFTEKLFVADADHTFVWDTVGAISKRVSRNSWLNSGTLTSDAPVTISQTWGTLNATYTAVKVVANETAVANISSNLLELWSGNAATLKVRVDKQGSIFFPSGQSIGNLNTSFVCGGGNFYPAGTLGGTSTLGTASVPFFGIWVGTSSNAAFLTSDAPNTLALRNGAAVPQAFRVYNTFLGTTANEWFEIDWKTTAGLLKIGTTSGGTGVGRPIELNASGNYINFNIGTVVKFAVVSNRNLSYQSIEWNTDNTHDIGASGANRPRNVYVGTSIVVGASDGLTGSITVGIGASRGIIFGNRGQIGAVGDGVFGFIDFAGSSFSRLQLGPNSDAAPAIARDGAGIKFTGAAAGLTSWIKVPPVAVSALPAAATAGAGARAFVNDASAPVFGSAVTGGGAVLVPVYCTGSAWNVG